MHASQAPSSATKQTFNTVVVEFGKKYHQWSCKPSRFTARLMPQGWGARPEPSLATGDLVLIHEGDGQVLKAAVVRTLKPVSGCLRVQFDVMPVVVQLPQALKDRLAQLLSERSRRAAPRLMLAYQGASKFEGNWQVLYTEETRALRDALSPLHAAHAAIDIALASLAEENRKAVRKERRKERRLRNSQLEVAGCATDAPTTVNSSCNILVVNLPVAYENTTAWPMSFTLKPGSRGIAPAELLVGDMVIYLAGGRIHQIGGIEAVYRDGTVLRADTILWDIDATPAPHEAFDAMLKRCCDPDVAAPLSATCAEEDYEGLWKILSHEEAKLARDCLGAFVYHDVLEAFWSPAERERFPNVYSNSLYSSNRQFLLRRMRRDLR